MALTPDDSTPYLLRADVQSPAADDAVMRGTSGLGKVASPCSQMAFRQA